MADDSPTPAAPAGSGWSAARDLPRPDTLEQATAERDGWADTAAQYHLNADYWRTRCEAAERERDAADEALAACRMEARHAIEAAERELASAMGYAESRLRQADEARASRQHALLKLADVERRLATLTARLREAVGLAGLFLDEWADWHPGDEGAKGFVSLRSRLSALDEASQDATTTLETPEG